MKPEPWVLTRLGSPPALGDGRSFHSERSTTAGMTRCSIAASPVSIAPVADPVVGMLKTPSRPAAIRTRKRRIDLPQETKTCDKILGINHIGSNQAS